MSTDTLSTMERFRFHSRPRLHTDDIAFWPFLYNLDRDFLLTVEHFFFYGYRASLLVWTRDGCVFAFGENFDGILGVGLDGKKHPWVEKPLEVVELRGREIVQMISGFHVMALTADGDLFGWGCNANGQVGVATYYKILSPVLVKSGVRLVCCGKTNTLALDTEGGVWCWGQGDKRNQFIPQKLPFPSPVVDLRCENRFEDYTSLALTAEHEVYLWGNRLDETVPHKLDLPNISPVVAIALVDHNILLFTANGEAFSHNQLELELELEDAKWNQVDLPEPIVPESLVLGTFVVVVKTFSGKLCGLLPFAFCSTTMIAHSSLTSLVDLCAVLEGSSWERVTPDLVTVSELARSRFDHFNNPPQEDSESIEELSPVLCVNRVFLAQRQPYFKEPSRLNDLRSDVNAPFNGRVIFSYMHYLHRGTLIDPDELVYPLWAQAYYFHDDQLHGRLTKRITFILCHLYLCHRAQLVQHFKQYLLEFFDSFTKNILVIFNPTSRLDTNLQALIIRWLILRSLTIINSRPYVNFPVKNLFDSNFIDSRYTDNHPAIESNSSDEWSTGDSTQDDSSSEEI